MASYNLACPPGSNFRQEYTVLISKCGIKLRHRLFCKWKTVKSDRTWRVTYEDKEWIDESGKASDTSATVYLDADCWNFNTKDQRPSLYQLPRKPMEAVTSEKKQDGVLYDFGRETFGYLVLKQLKGNGTVNVYYGESSEEALDTEHCETLDRVLLSTADSYTFSNSKAFRYIYVVTDKGISVDHVEMDYEYAPVDYRGSFRCNDKEMNRIWEVGAYTMHLTTREFLLTESNATVGFGVVMPSRVI